MEVGCAYSGHISCLLPEILTVIFTYLDTKSKGRVAQVCSYWREVVYNRRVWKGTEAKLHLKHANPSLFPSLVKRGIKNIQILSIRTNLRNIVLGVPNIETLNLSGCFNVTDGSLAVALNGNLSSLKALNLSLCKQVTDNSLGRIAKSLKNLEVLELGGCSTITNTGVLLIAWGLKSLKTLNLRSCRQISDLGIWHLAGLSGDAEGGCSLLEHLCLQDNQRLTGQALEFISTGLTNLKTINLSFCCVKDSGLKYLARMQSLQEINLRSCDSVTNVGLGYIANGTARLISLDVSFCDQVGDQGLISIAQSLFSLRKLGLSSCNVTDDGIERLVKSLQDLTTLHIGQCTGITDKGLVHIAENLKNLRSIDLYGCTRITTVGLEKIMQLRTLTTLNLGLWHKRDDCSSSSSREY